LEDLPQQLARLAILTKMLNRVENYKVMLIPLASKKEIGCSGQYCTEILKVASPDDEHTDIALEKPKYPSIEREYKCSKNHITKVYWYHEPFVSAVV
jgi:hypothetical protein